MKAPSGYRPAIDLARFIAAFGVVAAHAFASERDWVGHVALGLFLILTAFLSVQSMNRAGGRYPWIARARRLVLPWLFWSAVFRVVFFLVADGPERHALLSDPWTLLIGSSIHLWFLPFVMLAMALVEPSGRLIGDPRALAVATGALVAIGLPLFALHHFVPMPEPLPQWAFGLPVYAYGLLLAPAHALGRVGWLLAAVAVLSVGGYLMTGEVWALMPLVAALGFEVFWRAPLSGQWMKRLGQVAFGIYLVHPFFMLVCYKFLGPDVDRMLATVATFLMSWAAAEVLRRLPVLKTLV